MQITASIPHRLYYTKRSDFSAGKNENLPNDSRTANNLGHWTCAIDLNVPVQSEIIDEFSDFRSQHCFHCDVSGFFRHFDARLHSVFFDNFLIHWHRPVFCDYRCAKNAIAQLHGTYGRAHQPKWVRIQSNGNLILITLSTFISGLKNAAAKAIHDATDRHVEKLSRILNLDLATWLPQFIIWPTFVLCFVKYFAAGLDSDAFQLPFPFWWADQPHSRNFEIKMEWFAFSL